MVSKSKAAKKEQLRNLKAKPAAAAIAAVIPGKRNLDGILEQGDVDDEELLLTIETLDTLAQNPTRLKHKRIKPLKAAIHAFIRATGVSQTGSLTNRISDALTDARWTDARVLLSEFRIRREEVKLGTLQRWVREVDAAAAANNLEAGVSAEVFRTLDAILRATASKDTDAQQTLTDAPVRANHDAETIRRAGDGLLEADVSGVIHFAPPVHFSEASGLDIYKQVLLKSIFDGGRSVDAWKANAKIVEVAPAAERKPPNQFDAKIYTTLEPLVSSTHTQQQQQQHPVKHEILTVPGAFIIERLLTIEECKNIIRQGEAVEFSPDCAIAGSATQQASILAHNFYYFADKQTLENIYARALPFLPQEIEGCRVTGINARFRVYRYVPGAVYRPHIDGSWPRSGLDASKPEGKQYIYDDTREGAQLSRLSTLR